MLVYYEELLSAKSTLVASETIQSYHESIKAEVKKALEVSYRAREKGFDPTKEVEIYIAQDVASRTEGLVGPKGVATRFKEMENSGMVKDNIVVEIAKEIARGEFSPGTPEELADQALRTALSYQTEGITAAPIEGIAKVRVKSNPDGTQYLAVYYAGPIRSAGGTAQGVSIYLADIIRQELQLAEYKATEPEVERMLEETRLYNKIMHLQLPTSDEEIRHAWRNIPIMIHGEPTEREEISGYRNIDSMDSNRVRGGACLVLNDGLVGRAKKIMKRVKKLKLQGWNWLDEIASGKYSDQRETEGEKGSKPTEVKPDLSFASDALMGRPTFADATSTGGWRLRYGHARNTGIAGIGVHPGIMAVVNDFLAPGTHVRTERPGKGSIVTPVDSIRPPVVMLDTGDVVEVENYTHGVELRDRVKEILFMGDMLVGYGEFIQNNYRLCPVGYSEEWWIQELYQLKEKKAIPDSVLNSLVDIYYTKPSPQEALDLSKTYQITLHPKYVPTWKYLAPEDITILHREIWKDKLALSIKVKPILERALIPHQLVINGISIGDLLPILKAQLPQDADLEGDYQNGLEMVQKVSHVKILDTMGTTVGARMGRPEKAKSRHMSPKLHGLFPISNDKRVKRTLGNATEIGSVTVFLANRYCKPCDLSQWESYCRQCKSETSIEGRCTNRKCRAIMEEAPCDFCGSPFVSFTRPFDLDMHTILNEARSRLGSLGEKFVKLKDEINNPTGTPEMLEKGILRAKYDLHVFRDGTIRYDATDAPLTHFYPYEVQTSIEKLKLLGYTHDIYSNPLTNDDQLLEIKPQDIVLHESSIEHFTKVSQFVDDELEKIYGMNAYYNIKSAGDIVGHLVIGLAPHTSAGVIGRIIGFTRSSVCWAHPFWHSSKRRNCDGDEDGVILLLDGFLNFSKRYLPTTRGSKMDTPLVLVATLNPSEVDDEAFNLDSTSSYPIELYEAAASFEMPFAVSDLITRTEDKLGKVDQFEGFLFSHPTTNISEGPLTSRYKDDELKIRDKLDEQLKLAEMIRAVNKEQTALRILEKHALPDLIGNLRAFSSQTIRCVTCNSKYRRIPLSGKCSNADCTKSNLILTVFPKSVSKYFDVCEHLVMNYNLGKYHEDRLAKIKLALDSHFTEDGDIAEDLDLNEWF